MTHSHLPAARESAQRTYDRRRARTAAEHLAVIPPNRWDDRTRQIIATLATISAPSRIDDALDEAFEPPIGGAEQVHDMPSPACFRPSCGSPACVDCSSAGIPGVYPEPHPSLTAGDFADRSKQAGKHDNGDYRA